MDLHLNDKTALVTGSTAGIGLEIARKLAVEGAKVIVTGRNQAKLDQAVDSIRVSGGARVSGVLADASTEKGAAALVRATPSVDILVNNLGIYEIKDCARGGPSRALQRRLLRGNTNSTRRFRCRPARSSEPSGAVFGTTGRVAPSPEVTN